MDRRKKPTSRDGSEVELQHSEVPDAEERLRRAYEMILRAAARAEQQGNRQDDSPTDPSEADRG